MGALDQRCRRRQEQAMDAFNEPEYEECFAPLEEMREWDWEWNT